jgi:anti-anti-sigma regulatory factor
MAEPSYLDVRTEQGVVVLTLTEAQVRGDAMAEALREQFLAQVEGTGSRKYVIDFKNVEMATTVVFRPLLSLRRRLHELGDGRMVLCGLRPLVEESFRITRMVSTSGSSSAPFEQQPDVAAAIASLNH